MKKQFELNEEEVKLIQRAFNIYKDGLLSEKFNEGPEIQSLIDSECEDIKKLNYYFDHSLPFKKESEK